MHRRSHAIRRPGHPRRVLPGARTGLARAAGRRPRRRLDRETPPHGLKARPDLRVRVRLFGKREDFARYATDWKISGYEVNPGEVARADGGRLFVA